MLKNTAMAEYLSKIYGIPAVDIILIALNLEGVSLPDDKSGANRVRFLMRPLYINKVFFFAVSVNPASSFEYGNGKLYLCGECVGNVSKIANDTCDETYTRKGGRALTLNSNSRSTCRGCKFCGTYSLKANDFTDLRDCGNLRDKAEALLDSGTVINFADVDSIGLVTSCFENEKELLGHLLLVRRVFGEFGFRGEIRYIGSQLSSEEHLELLAAGGKFAYYLTVECFERRQELMRAEKAGVTPELGRNILNLAKAKGMNTGILYVLGLDSHEAMCSEFPLYREVLTRHPLVNVLQLYHPAQALLRNKDANEIDYYLKARLAIEKVFSPEMLPMGYDNYRSPWFSSYGEKSLCGAI